MRNASDSNGESGSCGFFDRNMLFFGCVHCVLHEELHRLTATDQFPVAFMQHLYDVSTNFALIDL
jgi:hypothetical protein